MPTDPVSFTTKVDGVDTVFAADVNNLQNAVINQRNFKTQVTAAGTTTLDITSEMTQAFTGTSTQTIVMPVTSTLYVGKTYKIINDSTGILTINSSGGNLIRTLPAGGRLEVVCILITGTTAASWDVFSYYSESGWISTNWASPTRTSNTVFTVAVDVTGIIAKGTKLKVTDTSTKYFVVVSVTFGAGVSTITTIASTDYAFAGNPSNIFYSNVEQPFGFPARFNFASTVIYSGGTTDPTSTTINTAYWRVINGDFFVTVRATLVRGTGNRTFTSFSIPITPLAISMLTGADDITAANLSSATSCYAYTDALIYYQRTMANNGNYYINGFLGF